MVSMANLFQSKQDFASKIQRAKIPTEGRNSRNCKR